MSDSQTYEEVTVTENGVTVTKRFEEDEFPVPAIAFEFSVDRDDAVLVSLRDSVPDNVAVEDLGFHPEYGSEFWSVEDDEIAFQRELEGGAEYTTVYGIRATGTDDVEKFLTKPELAEVTPKLAEDDIPEVGDAGEDTIVESDDESVSDVIGSESEAETDVADESEEDVETLDLKDPNREIEAESVSPEGSETADDSAEPDTSAEPETEPNAQPGTEDSSLVAAVADELRNNEVDAEDVKLLRRALELAGENDGSMRARVDQIQSDVSNLRAYTDALEEFLDDNGTAEQLIDDFRSDVDDLEATVQDLQESVDANREDVDSLDESVEELDEDVDEVTADMADFESSMAELEESVEDVESTLDELEDKVSDGDVAQRVDDLEAELDQLQTWQEKIKETFAG